MNSILIGFRFFVFLSMLFFYGCQVIPPYSKYDIDETKGTAVLSLDKGTPEGIFLYPRGNCNVGNFADKRSFSVEADEEFAFSVWFISQIEGKHADCYVWSSFIPKAGERYVYGIGASDQEKKCWVYMLRKLPDGELVKEETFVKAERDMSFFRDGPFCKVLRPEI